MCLARGQQWADGHGEKGEGCNRRKRLVVVGGSNQRPGADIRQQQAIEDRPERAQGNGHDGDRTENALSAENGRRLQPGSTAVVNGIAVTDQGGDPDQNRHRRERQQRSSDLWRFGERVNRTGVT